MTSPLPHRNFGAPQSRPLHPNSPTKCSPVAVAPALHQKVEQIVVEDSNEIDVPAVIRGTSPQSPTGLGSAANTTSEKKAVMDHHRSL
jgi:hypothetical protein